MEEFSRQERLRDHFRTGEIEADRAASLVVGARRVHGEAARVDQLAEERGLAQGLRGTTFDVYLAVVEDAVADSLPRPAAVTGARGVETILLVEDEPALRVVATTILEKQGYRVLVAASGAEALELSARTSGAIDLLLTDVVMPKMSGVELAELLVASRPSLKSCACPASPRRRWAAA